MPSSTNKPLISVVTPSWNRSKYLTNLWHGLSNQDFYDFEWVIANDGSTDDTDKIIKELVTKSNFEVTYICSDVRLGKAVMDNLLIKHSRGKFLVWNDSDDILHYNALSSLIDAWKQIGNKKEYIGVAALNTSKENIHQTNVKFSKQIFEDFFWNDLYKKSLGDSTMLIKKSLIGDKKFPEVDFFFPEGIFWNEIYRNKFIRFLKTEIKTMDRSAENSISHGNKIQYTKGSLMGITQNKFFYKLSIFWRINTVIKYVRFSIHSDIGFSKKLLSWKVLKRNPLYFLVFPAGYLLAIRDNYKNKVEKTFIEFEKNINQHNLQISRHKIIR